ncbi:MAG: aldose epimerase family protein [Candidatus Methylacidiphilales bacterium]
MPNGDPIWRASLQNSHGLTLRVISLGGIITELWVPDRKGSSADVVLGLKTAADYLSGHPWFGAITGRVAGRITSGRFELDETPYQLEINNPPNHLHGGSHALDKKNWAMEPFQTNCGEPAVALTYHSPDGDSGYPGNLDVRVVYTLTDDNALKIEYEAVTDRATPLSLTNHSYFNLAGEGSGSIGGHQIEIFADSFVPTDMDMTLTDEVVPVADKGNDLRQIRTLDEVIPGLFKAHGDNYVLSRCRPDQPILAARVSDPLCGRMMEVETTEQCLQFYTGVLLPEGKWTGKSGRIYHSHDGFCLECHGYPNGVRHPEITDIVLRPGQTYKQTTLYRFKTDQVA